LDTIVGQNTSEEGEKNMKKIILGIFAIRSILAACSVVAVMMAATVYAADPIVFPAKGQSNQQMESDKAACYSWAKGQTGFDPMQTPTASAPPPPTQGGAVKGAARGALAGVAIGAIAGDAGKGAAIGAASGGLVLAAHANNKGISSNSRLLSSKLPDTSRSEASITAPGPPAWKGKATPLNKRYGSSSLMKELFGTIFEAFPSSNTMFMCMSIRMNKY
jgi:hypothetical protein